MPNAAEMFAEHVATTVASSIPALAITRAKTFILDTLGVGVVGSSAEGAAALL